jgi:predicted HAD superfamily phosphohydrolase
MMDEVNPMAEMGFVHDKQIIVEAQGFLTPCDSIRDLASAVIKNGGKIYDLLDRYENVVNYVLNRSDAANATDCSRLLAPLLKAYGTTDFEVLQYYRENLPLLPGAKEVMKYFLDTMPTFIDTKMYEHGAYALCEKLEVPHAIANSSGLELDETDMSRKTCKDIREMAESIAKLRISKYQYEVNVPTELDDDEIRMINTLDDIYLKRMNNTEAQDMMQTMATVSANEKAYALLDIRKNTQVDLDGTAYIGGEFIDFQVMDLIKDGNGLAMSFNGSELAVHGSNVAVLSDDCTVAAVLVSKFYDTGIQGVFDLIENWNRETLEGPDMPDRNLVTEMLRRHPKKLPEVYRITRDNVDEIAAKSEAYRNKLFKKYARKPVTD